jgi:hypothetical protein
MIDDTYRCSPCLIFGYIWIIVAFLLLLARIVVWTLPVHFKQKTAKFALIIDGVVTLMVSVTTIHLTNL